MKSGFDYELIVIGGGSGGHAAASTGADLGLSCAVIENAEELGGLCILRGCMPSKALIETANRMRIIRDADRFGIQATPPSLDVSALRERVQMLVKDFKDSRVSAMTSGKYQLLRGTARFISEHEIELTDADGSVKRLKGQTFVIATGSTPNIPEIEGLKGTPYWTSDDLPKLPFLPKKLAIAGAGAIALECAHLFEGLGSEVTLLARGGHVLSGHDHDLSSALEAESLERGICFLRETTIEKVEHVAGNFRLTLKGSVKSLEVDGLLIATGRTPRTKGLGLEAIGVARDKGRILTDERSTTSLKHIFAAGDCSSPHAIVHLAVIQGEVAARNAHRLLYEDHTTTAAEWNGDSVMDAWFTEPQAVAIGLGEEDAKEKNTPFVTGRTEYSDHGKGMIAGSRHGFVKVIVSAADGRLLGAVGVGPDVAETGHLLQHAIEQGLTARDYLALPHYHPTFAEAWSRAVEEAVQNESGVY